MDNSNNETRRYDAIVVGSGITGGWAAKELTERGLSVLMIERGRDVKHGDYPTEHKPVNEFRYRLLGDQRGFAKEYPNQSTSWFFSEATQHFFVNDLDNPYTTPPGRPFNWIRGHHLGGRSLMWGRQSYRMAPLNFEENALDGHGVDWPIRYADLAPWYDHVERFIGVSGSRINHPMSPDGVFQAAMPMNAVERELQQRLARRYPERPLTMARAANLTEQIGERAPCHYCGTCERGCVTGSYFSTQSSTLPAAQKTGRLTVATDSIAARVVVDKESGRATGVEVIDAHSRARRVYQANIVFLCASAFESVRLLMLSGTDRQPDGLANSSGMLGKYIMDHFASDVAVVSMPGAQMPHLTGSRPIPLHIPRFRNVGTREMDFVRGYQINCGASVQDWQRGASMAGIGTSFKNALKKTGDWSIFFSAQCETLPRKENQLTLNRQVLDKWGMPVLHIDMSWGKNDLAMHKDASETCVEMLEAAGYQGVHRIPIQPVPGAGIHEMGGASMGRDRRTSVLDAHNRTHDIPNLFVTDGAAMSSSSSANPSLTYMALTARAAAFAATEYKAGRL